jgi:hypothetical protein
VTVALQWRMLPRPVGIRWRGPDLKPAALPTTPSLPQLTAIVGPPGTNASDNSIDALASASLTAGTVVFIDRATGQFRTADASFKPKAFVAGMLTASVAVGFVGHATRSRLNIADWTAVVGTAALAPGQVYFLAAGGGLTTSPPSSPNCLSVVGTALDGQTLLLSIQPPVQL